MHLHIVTQSIIYHRVHINVSMINNDYDIKLYMYTDTIRYILYVVHCTTELLPGLTLGNFWHGFGHCMIKKETPKNDSTSSKVSWTYFLKKETPHCKQCKTSITVEWLIAVPLRVFWRPQVFAPTLTLAISPALKCVARTSLFPSMKATTGYKKYGLPRNAIFSICQRVIDHGFL